MSSGPIGFVFFGSGERAAFEAAALLANASGMLLDKSDVKVDAFRKAGLPAEQADVVSFSNRNVARGAFLVDIVQELEGRRQFHQALIAATRAATDYVVIQHPYFDEDDDLALLGLQVVSRFGKRISYRPTIADYADFFAAHAESLRISGMAAFVHGRVAATPYSMAKPFIADAVKPVDVAKTIRIVVGRKDASRFDDVVGRAQIGEELLVCRWL